MPLPAGTRLGPYEVLALLGAGGMGEVYCARDTKLDREVAIKLVLDSFVADPDRAARFDREARALAALNHPNIATLFGFEQASGRHLLVMELVPGETLADRIARHPGGLPLDEALALAKQIAEALEAAHEKGIVHRDLKPANVKVTPDDRVKVLDFGLARVVERDAPSAASIAQSPTMSALGTQAGLILGTASYMSPEQARGYAADHRSDIFSFGIVLYEMLTGRQPFPGETISDVLAAVLARDPDLGALPSELSPRLIDLVRRCLEKNAKRRWQAIGDVRYELEALMANPRAVAQAEHVVAVAPPLPRWKRALPIAAAVILTALAVAGAAWAAWPVPHPPVVTRFTITPPEGKVLADSALQGLAVSPDGTSVAYATLGQIFVRTLSQFAPVPILSAESQTVLYNLTFSPDGSSLVYWSSGSIMRVPVTGGPSVTVAAAGPATPFGITWTGESLLYAHQTKILRVSADGGDPETLLELPAGEQPWRPQLLPDGRTLLFTVIPSGGGMFERSVLVAQRIGETARTKILDPAGDARFIAPGHIVFARQGVLLAVAFDPATLKTSGAPVPMVEGVRRTAANVQFAIGSSGVLAYVEGPVDTTAIPRSVVVAERSGARQFLKLPPGEYQSPRLAPDGRTMGVVLTEKSERSIWIYDIRGTSAARRLTFGTNDMSPVWTPDGTRVTFQSVRDGVAAIHWQRADGSGSSEQLTTPETGVRHAPMAWSPDGQVLLFDAVKDGEYRLMMWRARDKSVAPFATVRSTTPTGAVFSPDGRWITYTADPSAESGVRAAVFVQPFPATGALFQLSKSAEDGHHPVWANGGKELVYSPGGPRLVVVPLTLSPSFVPGEPLTPQRSFIDFGPLSSRPYDPAPGLRFLGLTTDDPPAPAGAPVPAAAAAAPRSREIKVVLNWLEELRAKVRR